MKVNCEVMQTAGVPCPGEADRSTGWNTITTRMLPLKHEAFHYLPICAKRWISIRAEQWHKVDDGFGIIERNDLVERDATILRMRRKTDEKYDPMSA
jgi:hypothetical protein